MRLLLALVCCLLIAACSKKTETPSTTNPNTTTPTDTNAMQYNVAGVADITINATDSVTRIIGLGYTKGTQEKVTLSISGVPSNVSITFDPASGIPSYTSTMKLNATNAAAGTYTIKIVVTTASNVSKNFEFNLKINAIPVKCNQEVASPNPSLAATYTASKRGVHTSTISISADITNENIITILPVWNFPSYITATVDCNTKTIAFSKQGPTSANYVQGTGSFNADSVVLDYVLGDPSVSGGTENVHLVIKK